MLKLTEASLNAAQRRRERPTEPMPLDGGLLLATGAVTGPHRRTRPIRRHALLRALIDFLLAPSPWRS